MRAVGLSGDDYTGLLAITAGDRAARPRGRDAVALAAPGRRPAPPLPPAGVPHAARRDDRRAGGHAARAHLRVHPHRAAPAAGEGPRRRPRAGDADDERRSRPRRALRPVAQRRRDHRVPGPQRPASDSPACSPATATASCSWTAAARTAATATRMASAGRSTDVARRIDFLEAPRRRRSPATSADSGLSVGGEMMLHTAAETEDLAAVVSEGAGARATPRSSTTSPARRPVADGACTTRQVPLPRGALNRCPPDNLTTLIPRIAPRPVFLINAAEGEVDDKTPEYFDSARRPNADTGRSRGAATPARSRPCPGSTSAASSASSTGAARRRVMRRYVRRSRRAASTASAAMRAALTTHHWQKASMRTASTHVR